MTSTEPRTEVDPLTSALTSALHSAFQSVMPPTHHHADRHDPTYKKDDKLPSIEIDVDSDASILRGTGAEVAPDTLCSHEWSFLEGEKKHSHTLKAGRHLFPFQLNIGDSLPSTLYTDAYGGASVAYKLRAIATRPGFAHNLHTQRVIKLLRSFGPEAIEYQQSLEIESTWPEKLMYSIMIPHKAWSAGDNLIAVVKFSPLAKGVRVLSAITTLNETIKTFTRTGRLESTKTLIQVNLSTSSVTVKQCA
jgi:hypothetical protein